MFKGWLVIVFLLSMVLGSMALIKSINAICGAEFMHVGLCENVPIIETSFILI